MMLSLSQQVGTLTGLGGGQFDIETRFIAMSRKVSEVSATNQQRLNETIHHLDRIKFTCAPSPIHERLARQPPKLISHLSVFA